MAYTASFAIFLLSIFASVKGQDYCYATDEIPYYRQSVYSSYFPFQNSNADQLQFPGCTARSYWAFTRHGARNPSESQLEDFEAKVPRIQTEVLQNNAEGRGSLCQEDLDLIAIWSQEIGTAQAYELMGSGYVEMEEMGARFRARLPEVLQVPYDINNVRVRTTAYSRTEQSLRAYLAGVFSEDPSTFYVPTPLDPDPLLRFYDVCTKYQEDVVNNPATRDQQNLFVNSSQEIGLVVFNVNRRFGYPDDSQLPFEDIKTLYDICRFDKSRRPNSPSAWCAAFDEIDMEIMEYHEDLFFWYQDSYGSYINEEFGCPLVQDMANTFNQDDGAIPSAVIYAGHGDANILTYTTLGLFRDDNPLLSTNYQENQDRAFSTSLQSPFSANFEFILFNCDEGGETPVKRVLFQQNEVTLTLPGCSEELCLFDEFLQIYQDVVQCPFDQICEN